MTDESDTAADGLVEETSGDRGGRIPAAEWLMDGTKHSRDPSCCMRCLCNCGGQMHYQAMHGSFMYLCEKCGARS